MQGSVYELQLSVLRQRSREAQWQKAGRGELFTTVAIGYVRVGDGRIEMDPDQRVRDAVALVFRKFAEFGSGRQVHLWLRQEGIELPAVWYGPRGREVIWKLPVYNSIKKMLANPVYAGAYVWGRSITRVDLAGGYKRIARELRSNPEDWPILIVDHHDGYTSWEGNCSPGGSSGYSVSWLRQWTAFPCRAMLMATRGLYPSAAMVWR